MERQLTLIDRVNGIIKPVPCKNIVRIGNGDYDDFSIPLKEGISDYHAQIIRENCEDFVDANSGSILVNGTYEGMTLLNEGDEITIIPQGNFSPIILTASYLDRERMREKYGKKSKQENILAALFLILVSEEFLKK